MSQNMTIVYSKVVEITESKLKTYIKYLNNDVYVDEGDKILTLEEVLGNKKLLDYICGEVIDDKLRLFNAHECWANDGWCDWTDFR